MSVPPRALGRPQSLSYRLLDSNFTEEQPEPFPLGLLAVRCGRFQRLTPQDGVKHDLLDFTHSPCMTTRGPRDKSVFPGKELLETLPVRGAATLFHEPSLLLALSTACLGLTACLSWGHLSGWARTWEWAWASGGPAEAPESEVGARGPWDCRHGTEVPWGEGRV